MKKDTFLNAMIILLLTISGILLVTAAFILGIIPGMIILGVVILILRKYVLKDFLAKFNEKYGEKIESK